MNRKLHKLLVLLALLGIICLSFAACSTYEEFDSIGMNTMDQENVTEDLAGSLAETTAVEDVRSDRKIIENIDLSVQTKEFDTLLENINTKISELGGYVESSDISGREMDAYNNRTAEMTVRIPAEKSDAFTGFISENSVVVNRSVTTEDVTLKYVDMESRLAALKAEKTSLEKLLENAERVEDIITVREQLTQVIGDIESYTAQLRTLDNLVDYCTVEIYIDEVERTAVVEEQNVWQRIGTNLSNNFSNMWDGTVDLFVALISATPYLIPPAVVALVIVVIVKLCLRASKKKSEKKEKK